MNEFENKPESTEMPPVHIERDEPVQAGGVSDTGAENTAPREAPKQRLNRFPKMVVPITERAWAAHLPANRLKLRRRSHTGPNLLSRSRMVGQSLPHSRYKINSQQMVTRRTAMEQAATEPTRATVIRPAPKSGWRWAPRSFCGCWAVAPSFPSWRL